MATFFKYFIQPEAGEFCFAIKTESAKKIKLAISLYGDMCGGEQATEYAYEDLKDIDDFELLYGDLNETIVILMKDVVDLDYLNDIIKSTKLKVLLIG